MRNSQPRVIFLRRRTVLLLCAAVLCTLGVLLCTLRPAGITANAAKRQLPIYCVDCAEKRCAISFDAAWGDVRVR